MRAGGGRRARARWASVGALAALALTLAAGTAAGQDRPEYCTSGSDLGWGPTFGPLGLEAEGWACVSGHDNTSFPLSWSLRAAGRYLWVDRDAEVPDATQASVGAFLSVSIASRPSRADSTCGMDDDCFFEGNGGWNLGFLDLGGRMEYLASADGDESHFAFAGEARWARTSQGWLRLLPTVVYTLEWVQPQTSASRRELGILPPLDTHSRHTLRFYLNTTLSFVSPAAERLRVVGDVRLFRADGMAPALEELGWASGEFYSAGLGYRVGGSLGPITVDWLWLRWSEGQLPVDGTAQEALTGGLTLGFR